MSMTSPTLAAPGPAAVGPDRRPDVDLLAPSIWSDRARLLARPDVVAVELLVLCAFAILLRQPLSELLGTAGEVPVAPAAPAPDPAPASPLALVPVAPPAAARHEPRDPFAPLVSADVPAEGAPPAPAAQPSFTVVEPAPASAPTAPTTPTPPTDPAAPAVEPTSTVTVQPGEALWVIAARNGTTTAALYAANRDTIGPDPNLIRPGLVLVLP